MAGTGPDDPFYLNLNFNSHGNFREMALPDGLEKKDNGSSADAG